MQWDKWYEDLRWKFLTGQVGNGILSQITNNGTENINQ